MSSIEGLECPGRVVQLFAILYSREGGRGVRDSKKTMLWHVASWRRSNQNKSARSFGPRVPEKSATPPPFPGSPSSSREEQLLFFLFLRVKKGAMKVRLVFPVVLFSEDVS